MDEDVVHIEFVNEIHYERFLERLFQIQDQHPPGDMEPVLHELYYAEWDIKFLCRLKDKTVKNLQQIKDERKKLRDLISSLRAWMRQVHDNIRMKREQKRVSQGEMDSVISQSENSRSLTEAQERGWKKEMIRKNKEESKMYKERVVKIEERDILKDMLLHLESNHLKLKKKKKKVKQKLNYLDIKENELNEELKTIFGFQLRLDERLLQIQDTLHCNEFYDPDWVNTYRVIHKVQELLAENRSQLRTTA